MGIGRGLLKGGSGQGCADSEAGMGGQMGFWDPCFVSSRYKDLNTLPDVSVGRTMKIAEIHPYMGHSHPENLT